MFSRTRQRDRSVDSRFRAFVAALASLVLVGTGVAAGAAPAAADDPPLLQLLTLTKDNDNQVVAPGGTFTYTLFVGCNQAVEGCIDAAITDQLPAELEGFQLAGVDISHTGGGAAPTYAWENLDQTTSPVVLGSDSKLTVTPQQSLPDGNIGIRVGQGVTVTLTLQAPQNLLPTWPHNDTTITNTAEATAANSAVAQGTAPVTVVVNQTVDVGATKTWEPGSASILEGTESTITMGVTNTSNIPVDTLVLQEPLAAADGATTLDASNAFTIADFTGFGSSVLPAGATGVATEVYVWNGSAYEWQAAASGAEPSLGAVPPADVAGIRLTYTGDAIEIGASSSIPLDLAQRGTVRGSDDPVTSTTVDNVLGGTAVREGVGERSTTATARHTISPAAIGANITKDIAPERVAAGASATATLVGTNTTPTGANTLTISDHGYFVPGEITFGGLTAAPTSPSTNPANTPLTGHVTFTSFGDVVQTVPIVAGEVPSPTEFALDDVAGFDVVWTAPEGAVITTATGSTVAFGIDTAGDAADEPNHPNPRTTENTASAEVSTPFGTAGGEASDTLVVFAPSMEISLEKTVSPNTAVRPGDQVLSQLKPSFQTTSTSITPTELIVEDTLALSQDQPNGGFWNGFDLYSIAPTGLPAGTALAVEVQIGGAWHTVLTQTPTGSSVVVSLTHEQLAAAIPGGNSTSEITGTRFTFTNPQGVSASLIPNLAFEARESQRDGSGPTSTPGGDPTSYENVAHATGTARDDAGRDHTDEDTADGVGSIVIPPNDDTGVGPDFHIGKDWKLAATGVAAAEPLPALSSDRVWTALEWRVDAPVDGQFGADSVTLQDHGTITGVSAQTVYDAFDLVGIEPIANSGTVGSNGWALRWDKITAIEIHNGTDWVTPTGAEGLLADGNAVNQTLNAQGVPTASSLPRITLTSAERASATALRITLEPNLDTRLAGAAAGVANVPGINAGVVSTTSNREFRLEWELRDTLRSDPDVWVTPDTVFNHSENTIENVVRMSVGDRAKVADDIINLVSAPPSVNIAKTASPTSVTVPGEHVPQSEYPTTRFTSTASSTGPAAPSYLRISDPMPCTEAEGCAFDNTAAGIAADPYAVAPAGGWLTPDGGAASPFDSFTITGITAATTMSAADLAASTAWVLRYDEAIGAYSSESLPVSALNALPADQLSDVVAVTVTFQGSDPVPGPGKLISESDQFTLTIDTQLRETIRSTGAPQQLPPNATAEVVNTSFAQVWDPILNMGEDGVSTTDTSNARVALQGQSIAVAPGKTVAPASVLAVDRTVPVSVELTANDADSTLPPSQVWLKDDVDTSAEFWNVFELTALDGALTAPADADRVQIDLLVGTDWVAGDIQQVVDASLPDVASLSDVTGIRVTFSRADGEFLDSETWSAVVPLTFGVRDSYVFPVSGEQTVTNTVQVQSVRDTTNPDSAANSVVEEATDEITLSSGFFAISVNKLANDGERSVEFGVPIPWQLSFTNTGTGALTITELVDYLGDTDPDGSRVPGSNHLVPATPLNLTYETSAGGTLATSDILYEFDPETHELIWTWPEEGNTMAPGETFTIRLDMELLPGLQSGQSAFNSMEVNTEEVLDGGVGPGGELIPPYTNSDPVMQQNPNNGSWGGDHTAGTKDYVQPRPELNLWVQKSVYGSLGTAATAGEECSPTTPGPDGQNYFPSPCLSDTQYSWNDDIVDKWLLRTSNTTTTAVKEIVVYDDLPVSGDKFLIGGASRGSDYRPVLVAEPVVHLPAGITATTVLEVTSDLDACQDTWPHIVANPGAVPCEENGATWTAASDSTDWSQVTGLRIRVVFDDATPLGNGQTVDVTFETRNVVDPAADTALSADVPVPDQEAWNQFGAQWQFANASQSWSQRIPARVGVTPQSGPLQINKVIGGDAVEFAPASFEFEVQCSITQPSGYDTTALAVVDGGVVTVTRDADGVYQPVRIDGIPLGAECSVTETGDGGASSILVDPGSVTIDQPADSEDAVPATQIVTVTNTFDNSSLTLAKQVTGAGADYGTGPFELQASCEFNGLPVDLADDGIVTLPTAEGSWSATLSGVPVGAECSVSETEDGGATSTTIQPDGVIIVQPDGDADFSAITVTNDFELGGLEIFKELAGDGAPEYGDGPFTFVAQCAFQGAPVDLGERGTVVLPTVDGAWSSVIDRLPVGAECEVTETTTGGATATELYPNDGAVTIPAPGDGDQPVFAAVSATNTFDIGALEITKEVTGSGADEYGNGPFLFQTQCTYVRDGQPVDISLPDGGLASLPVDGAASPWTVTYGNLIVDAECVVEEIDSAGATSTALDPVDGTVTIPPVSEGQARTALVAATNTFDVGHVSVEKLVDGPFGLDGDELRDLTFTVDWTASNNETGRLELSAASDWEAFTKDLPVGTSVTLTEAALPELPPHVGFTGFRWIATDGVAVSEDGSEATVSIGAAPVQLQVENSFVLKTGTFEIAKLIDGPFSAASEEMRDRTFIVGWAAGDRTGEIELNAGNGWTGGPDAVFPVGSTVELSEADISDLPPHVQFEGASWADAPGLVAGSDGTATLTVGEGEPAGLELSNEFSLLTGTFGVEKLIAGDLSQDAPEFADVTFVVAYEVSTGATGQLELNRDGEWSAQAEQFPTGSTVVLTELAVDQGDLAPHVKWDGYAWAGGDGYDVSEDGLTATLVVGDGTSVELELENAFTELLGSFAVQKQVTGDFVLTDPQLSGLVFEVDYTVSTGETGTLELSAENGWTAGPDEVFRAGSTVELTEAAPTGTGPSVHWEGYAWLPTDDITVSDDGQTATITVGDAGAVRLQVENAFTELTGTFAVEKLVEGDFALTDAELWDRTFVVAYEAADGVTGEIVTGQLDLDGDRDWQAQAGADFPAGTTVTLTELDVQGLPPHVRWDGYQWLAGEGVAISPDGRTSTIVVGDGSTPQLELENHFTQLVGGFTVTKDVAGEGADRVPADLEFFVEYSLDEGQTWTPLPAVSKDEPVAEGPSDLRLGTEVLIREGAPTVLPDVEWGSPAFHGVGVTPGVDGEPASFVVDSVDSKVDVQLTNPTTPLNGQFEVTKKITGGGTSLVDGDPLFTLEYASGDLAGELTVRGDQVVSSAPFPAGSEVTITEVRPSGGLVAGASWGTPVFVLQDGTVLENGSTITIEADQVISLVLENPTIPPLPVTGSQVSWIPIGLAALALAAGITFLMVTRRRTVGE